MKEKLFLRIQGVYFAFEKLEVFSAIKLCLMWLLKRYFKVNKIIGVKMKNGEKLFLRTNSMDFNIFLRMILNESSNEYNIDFEKYLSKNKNLVILDGGANIGLFTYFILNKFNDVKVIAVEPDKDNYKILRNNLKKYNNVICINGGIWNYNANLQIMGTSCGTVGFVVEEISNPQGKEYIRGFGISDIMKKYHIDHFDIIKLDIEGSEYYVFDEEEYAWLNDTEMVMMELHDHIKMGASKRVFDVLQKKKGYIAYEYNGNYFFHKPKDDMRYSNY